MVLRRPARSHGWPVPSAVRTLLFSRLLLLLLVLAVWCSVTVAQTGHCTGLARSACAIAQFTTNLTQFQQQGINYLDYGEVLTFRVDVDPHYEHRNAAFSVSYTTTNATVVGVSVARSGKLGAVVSVRDRGNLYPSSSAALLATGAANVTVIPQPYSSDCTVGAVVTVQTGCPPNRRLLVQRPDSADCAPFDTDPTFNMTRWGCPMSVYYNLEGGTALNFTILDNTTLVRTVVANYTLTELRNRTDFDSVAGNDSSTAGLKFSRSAGGLYYFRAVVTQPNVSYCILQDEFAVYVYGVPIGEGARAGILVGFVVAMVAVLVATYFYYRNERSKLSLNVS